MKVVRYLIPSDHTGGVEVAARSLADRMENDYTFKKLYLYHDLPGSGLKANLLGFLRGWRQLKASNVDILIVSLWRSALIGAIYKLFHPRRTTLVLFLHLPRSLHLLDLCSNFLGLLFASEIWADSTATLQARFRGISFGKPSRVLSYLPSKYRPVVDLKKPNLRFLYWGRISRQKNLKAAVDLIILLAERQVACPHLTLIGSGRAGLENLMLYIRRKKADHLVEIMQEKSIEELAAIAKEHTFYISTSYSEGMSLSTQEAMQFGLIPVVTKVGEVQRYCNSYNSIEVNLNNLSITVDSVISLVDDTRRYHSMRENAVGHWEKQSLFADDFFLHIGKLANK